MYRHLVKSMANGHEVYVNLIASSAGQYLSRQPYVLGLVKELIESLRFENQSIALERDMGRVIGNTDIVETSEKDTIYYAKPYKKTVFSRFAKNRYPSRSSKLTVVLEQDGDGNYELIDTWIGPHCPPFPGDEHATTSSKVYWQTHALVQDSQTIQSNSVTKVCPY